MWPTSQKNRKRAHKLQETDQCSWCVSQTCVGTISSNLGSLSGGVKSIPYHKIDHESYRIISNHIESYRIISLDTVHKNLNHHHHHHHQHHVCSLQNKIWDIVSENRFNRLGNQGGKASGKCRIIQSTGRHIWNLISITWNSWKAKKCEIYHPK